MGLEREPMGAAVDHPRQDAGLLEHLQVPGDGGLRHPKPSGDITDRRRTSGQTLHDAAANRVRERLERIVNHYVNSSTKLTMQLATELLASCNNAHALPTQCSRRRGRASGAA